MAFVVKQKVHVSLPETSKLGGGRHRGIIENIVADMYDGSPLFLVRIKGDIVAVREGAMTAYITKKKI